MNNLHLNNFLKNVIKKINKLSLDYVIHCGGIVEEGISKNFSLAEKYLSDIDSDVLFTPAGCDINYQGYFLFEEYFGKIDQIITEKNIVYQGVSSSQYDSKIGIIGECERKKYLANLKNIIKSLNVYFYIIM